MPSGLKPCWMIRFLKNMLISKKCSTILHQKIVAGIGMNSASCSKGVVFVNVTRRNKLIFVISATCFHAKRPGTDPDMHRINDLCLIIGFSVQD